MKEGQRETISPRRGVVETVNNDKKWNTETDAEI